LHLAAAAAKQPREQEENQPMSLLQTAVAALRESFVARAGALVCLVLIAALSLWPGDWQNGVPMNNHSHHFAAYLGTALVLSFALPRRVSPIVGLVVLLAYSGLMEMLQQFSPGRDPKLSDAIFSSLGAVPGVAISAWLFRRYDASSPQQIRSAG
jgi:VanZ family protein